MKWPLRTAVALTMLAGTLGASPANAADTDSWQSATLTATVAGADLGNVTVTGTGETFAAWTQAVGGNFQAEVSRGGKTTPTTWHLDSATAVASNTRIAMAADGSVGFAVYMKMVGADRRLWWSLWNGTAWSTGAQLATSIDFNTAPAVDIRDDGTFGVVAWRGSGGSVFARRFDGSAFVGPDTLTADSTGSLSVSVARAANKALLSWVDSSKVLSRAWTGASWGALRGLSPVGEFSPEGEVELSDDGTAAMAILKSFIGGQWVARSARGNGDSWNAPAPLHTGGYADLESLDIELSGDATSALATWSGDTGGVDPTTYVYRNRWASGAWDGSIIASGPYLNDSHPDPNVAISGSGDRAVLGYQDRSGSQYRGQTHVFTAGVWSDFRSMTQTSSNAASGRTQVALTRQGTRGAAVSLQQTGGQQYLKLNTLTVYTVPDPPPAPSARYIANAYGSGVLVTWQQTTFNGNDPVMDYVMESDPAGASCAPGGTFLSCLVQGMTPGVPYRFRVYATNARGTSAPSAWSEFVTVPVADPGGGGTPGGSPVASTPTVQQLTVAQKKRVGPKRKVVVRWVASGATLQQLRLTRPGGKKWRKWQDVSGTRKVVKLRRGKVYKVGVRVRNADAVSPVLVKRFKVKR